MATVAMHVWYVCVHVCMYVCMCVCTNVCILMAKVTEAIRGVAVWQGNAAAVLECCCSVGTLLQCWNAAAVVTVSHLYFYD